MIKPKEEIKMQTREQWLEKLTQRLNALFYKAEKVVPKIRISCGWPSKSARSILRRSVGECFPPEMSDDNTTEIFISPFLDDSIEVGATLVHELCHAVLWCRHGHGHVFRNLAIKVGLRGPMPSTYAGEELTKRLNDLMSQIGPYPHARIDPDAYVKSGIYKKDKTRLKKVKCSNPMCGCIIRMTQFWINKGLPTCFCGEKMRVDISNK